MPIKPENRHRYPKDWPQIRARILARAGNACEKCKAPNRTRIARGAGKDEGTYMLDSADVFCADTGQHLGQCRHSDYELARMVDIVLTIAHLDDGHAHGRVFFASHGDFDRVVHADHLRSCDDLRARMVERRQRVRQANEQELRVRVGV